ncbi:protein kinase domain-containing protein [Gordonia polyisoprenivorans]|uniref:protein kinase domain-containing protein n=1 Tax=Gordonia polyisoprenivorans TaxID=84595 RepID=UPI00054E1024|nr:protein kinase [Gordonia polyisoprenivorans]
MVGQEFAGYRIVRVLGAGGMGEVYLAQHPRLPRLDALKVLPANLSSDDAFRRRFTREADLAVRLDHPNVVNVYDRGEHDGQLWIAMRYVEGLDASELLTSHPSGLPVDEVVHIVSAVADALDHAHSQNLLHRDVKPANILLTDAAGPSGLRRVLLADFGIARPILDDARLTATNLTVGSFAYSSPEQLAAEKLDGRADQYSLACTAYQLLSGATPFVDTNAAALIRLHMTETPPPITTRRSDLSPRVDQVLHRALAKDPNRRYASCTEFAAELGAALTATKSVPTVAPPAPFRPAPQHTDTSKRESRPPSTGPQTITSSRSTPHPGHSSLPPIATGVTPAPYPPTYTPSSYAVTAHGPAAAFPAAPNQRANSYALWSLLTALASFVGSCLFGVGGILLGGASIYLGVTSLKMTNAQLPPGALPQSNKRGLAIAGIVVGILGLLFSIVMLAAFIATI